MNVSLPNTYRLPFIPDTPRAPCLFVRHVTRVSRSLLSHLRNLLSLNGTIVTWASRIKTWRSDACNSGVASNSRPELATCHGRGRPCHNAYQKNFFCPWGI